MRAAACRIAVALALAACARRAQAQSEPDSALGAFLKSRADSSDRYFGLAAAPLDTSGLDSALAYGLAHPALATRRRLELSKGPWLAFNRVDGALYGAALGRSLGRGGGTITGRLGYAGGSDRWLGGGEYRKSWWRRGRDPRWRLELTAGRFTEGMDPDHSDRLLSSFRALVFGNDRTNYLRRDGVTVALERESPRWRAEATLRDQLESPLIVTTGWNLANREPVVPDNLAARLGRVREAGLSGTLRLARLPVWLEGDYRTSGHVLNSAFEYRRSRVSLGADISIGRIASLLPEVVYGRLNGEAVPQASFYLGGSRSLRSVPRQSIGGTGLALARFELIGARDLLAFARGPRSALPLQAGVFAAIGAVWGADPGGGPARPGDGWPASSEWLSELGFSLLYRPGLPDPSGFLRLDYAVPLGFRERETQFALHYSHALPWVHVLEP